MKSTTNIEDEFHTIKKELIDFIHSTPLRDNQETTNLLQKLREDSNMAKILVDLTQLLDILCVGLKEPSFILNMIKCLISPHNDGDQKQALRRLNDKMQSQEFMALLLFLFNHVIPMTRVLMEMKLYQNSNSQEGDLKLQLSILQGSFLMNLVEKVEQASSPLVRLYNYIYRETDERQLSLQKIKLISKSKAEKVAIVAEEYKRFINEIRKSYRVSVLDIQDIPRADCSSFLVKVEKFYFNIHPDQAPKEFEVDQSYLTKLKEDFLKEEAVKTGNVIEAKAKGVENEPQVTSEKIISTPIQEKNELVEDLIEKGNSLKEKDKFSDSGIEAKGQDTENESYIPSTEEKIQVIEDKFKQQSLLIELLIKDNKEEKEEGKKNMEKLTHDHMKMKSELENAVQQFQLMTNIIQKDNTQLKEDNTQLKEDNIQLREDNIQLRAVNTQLKEDNIQLREDNIQLKEDNSRLKNDSAVWKEDLKLLIEEQERHKSLIKDQGVSIQSLSLQIENQNRSITGLGKYMKLLYSRKVGKSFLNSLRLFYGFDKFHGYSDLVDRLHFAHKNFQFNISKQDFLKMCSFLVSLVLSGNSLAHLNEDEIKGINALSKYPIIPLTIDSFIEDLFELNLKEEYSDDLKQYPFSL